MYFGEESVPLINSIQTVQSHKRSRVSSQYDWSPHSHDCNRNYRFTPYTLPYRNQFSSIRTSLQPWNESYQPSISFPEEDTLQSYFCASTENFIAWQAAEQSRKKSLMTYRPQEIEIGIPTMAQLPNSNINIDENELVTSNAFQLPNIRHSFVEPTQFIKSPICCSDAFYSRHLPVKPEDYSVDDESTSDEEVHHEEANTNNNTNAQNCTQDYDMGETYLSDQYPLQVIIEELSMDETTSITITYNNNPDPETDSMNVNENEDVAENEIQHSEQLFDFEIVPNNDSSANNEYFDEENITSSNESNNSVQSEDHFLDTEGISDSDNSVDSEDSFLRNITTVHNNDMDYSPSENESGDENSDDSDTAYTIYFGSEYSEDEEESNEEENEPSITNEADIDEADITDEANTNEQINNFDSDITGNHSSYGMWMIIP